MKKLALQRDNLLSVLEELVKGPYGMLLLFMGAIVGMGALFLTYLILRMSFQYRDYSVPVGLTLVALSLLAVTYIAKHWHRSTLAHFSKHYKRGKLGSVINIEQFMSAPTLPANPFADRKYAPFHDAISGRLKGYKTSKCSLKGKRATRRTLNKFPYV